MKKPPRFQGKPTCCPAKSVHGPGSAGSSELAAILPGTNDHGDIEPVPSSADRRDMLGDPVQLFGIDMIGKDAVVARRSRGVSSANPNGSRSPSARFMCAQTSPLKSAVSQRSR
jgi:hypothetical protein